MRFRDVLPAIRKGKIAIMPIGRSFIWVIKETLPSLRLDDEDFGSDSWDILEDKE